MKPMSNHGAVQNNIQTHTSREVRRRRCSNKTRNYFHFNRMKENEEVGQGLILCIICRKGVGFYVVSLFFFLKMYDYAFVYCHFWYLLFIFDGIS